MRSKLHDSIRFFGDASGDVRGNSSYSFPVSHIRKVNRCRIHAFCDLVSLRLFARTEICVEIYQPESWNVIGRNEATWWVDSDVSRVLLRSTSRSVTSHGVCSTFAAALVSLGTMASMASSLAGTPIITRPRASAGTKSRRPMRCNASATSDAAAAALELGYPFVQIVGQEELKLMLTLNVVVRTITLSERGDVHVVAGRESS